MKYLKIFTDFVEDITPLGDAERGRLFTAMLQYAGAGTEPKLLGNERFLWNTAKRNIDNQESSYQDRCRANRQNASKANRSESLRIAANRCDSQEDKEKDKDKDKENTPDGVISRAKFAPPTLEQVRAYIAERNSPVDPEEFVDFYASKGWKVGREPMRDWKAACRNAERWEKYRDRKAGASRSAPDEYSLAAVRQLMSEEVD